MRRTLLLLPLFILALVIALAGCSSHDDPPAPVTNLQAEPRDGAVILSWDEPSDADFARLEIAYGAKTIKIGPTTKVMVVGLANETSYTFTVQTVDEGGNKSEGTAVNATPTADVTGGFPMPTISTENLDQPLSPWWQDRIDFYNTYVRPRLNPASAGRGREIAMYTNHIDIYVYNPSDRMNDSIIIPIDILTLDPVDVEIPLAAGPYTIEIYASWWDGDVTYNCYTSAKVTNVVPGSGTIDITLNRPTYDADEDMLPPLSIVENDTLTLGCYMSVPVDMPCVDDTESSIDDIYMEFNNNATGNNFQIWPGWGPFTAGDGQHLVFSGSADPTLNFGADLVFDCSVIGITYFHYYLARTYVFYYWQGADVYTPDHIFQITVTKP